MLYEQDITITSSHTATSPYIYPLKVTHGIIHKLDVYFPPGCAHLVRIKLFKGSHQIFPTNPDGYLKGDGVLVSGTDFQPILKAPYVVDVKAWQVGASYDHTITVRLWILKVWQMVPFSDEMFRLAVEESAG